MSVICGCLELNSNRKLTTLCGSDSMSLQTYTPDYWPGMLTTALSIVHVNAAFYLKMQRKDFSIFRGASLV